MAFKTLMGIERLLSELGINLHMELEQLEGERLTLFQSASCQRAVRLLTAAGIPFPDVLYEETTRTPHFRGRLSVHAGANKQDTQVEWIASFKDEVTPCFEVLKFKLDPSFKDDVILWLYEEPVMEGDWLIFHDIDASQFVFGRDLLKPAYGQLVKMLFGLDSAWADVEMLAEVTPVVDRAFSVNINDTPTHRLAANRRPFLFEWEPTRSVDYLALAAQVFLRDQPDHITKVNLTFDDETGQIAMDGE